MADETRTISMIHPNLFNRALKRCGIEGVEVVEGGDTGLQLKTERTDLNSELVNLALMIDTTVNMVLDSNLTGIEDVRDEVRRMSADRTYRITSAELQEVAEELDDKIANLRRNMRNFRRDIHPGGDDD